jgi:hypothetical protein
VWELSLRKERARVPENTHCSFSCEQTESYTKKKKKTKKKKNPQPNPKKSNNNKKQKKQTKFKEQNSKRASAHGTGRSIVAEGRGQQLR